jgi:uncharacterized protein with NRDE domain
MTEKELDKLARKLTDLVEIFRQGQAARDFKWWNENSSRSIFNPTYGYQEGQQLFEELVQSILRLNPIMLSEDGVKRKLMYEFLQEQTINITEENHAHNEELVSQALAFVKDMAEFKAWQNVDVAIGNLWLRGDPVIFGEVTFLPIDPKEIEKWESQLGPKGDSDISVRVIARLKAPEDRTKVISYTQNRVNQVLDIFRAFCFPFGRHSDAWRIALVNDPVSQTYTLLRINRRFTTLVSSGIAQIDLREHILSKLTEPQWNLIHKLFEKPEKALNDMENKLLNGIYWLSQSTKPDTYSAKFTKICFALEAMLGGEPKDEELKIRGITAMLAERAAFLTGKNLDDRLNIDRAIRNSYRIRSKIVHGVGTSIHLDDIDKVGILARRIALTLLDKLDTLGNEISNVDKLEEWVRNQKYTLPNSEEVT